MPMPFKIKLIMSNNCCTLFKFYIFLATTVSGHAQIVRLTYAPAAPPRNARQTVPARNADSHDHFGSGIASAQSASLFLGDVAWECLQTIDRIPNALPHVTELPRAGISEVKTFHVYIS